MSVNPMEYSMLFFLFFRFLYLFGSVPADFDVKNYKNMHYFVILVSKIRKYAKIYTKSHSICCT